MNEEKDLPLVKNRKPGRPRTRVNESRAKGKKKMSEQEAARKLSDEEKRIKSAVRNVLPKLGHNNCDVICPNRPVIAYEGIDGVSAPIPQWAIRATDDQGQTCRIDITVDPAETDEQIQKKLQEAFSAARWQPR